VRSDFGERADPLDGARSFHQGIDIDSADGERVLAAADGEVVFASAMSGYGTVVMLDHGGRTITLYAHLNRAVVRLGEQVARGRTIGYVGSEGRATGPHLHFEVRVKGVPADPLDRLP
jgi:murein DD-endopeptidase MepM/ murein hydrolase activator NlpD